MCLEGEERDGEFFPVRVAVTLAGDTAVVDFTGSVAQVDGPVNANLAVTTAATMYVFRCLVPEEIPFTSGILRPIRIMAPEGSMVNARAPAAMAAGNVETSQRITDVRSGRAGEGRAGTYSRGELRHHEQLELWRRSARAGKRSPITKPSPEAWARRQWRRATAPRTRT